MRKMNAEDAKREAVLITGITLSGMIRTFEKDTKKKFLEIPSTLNEIYQVRSDKQFDEIHSQFCEWGCKNIKRNARVKRKNASYGQIAKTFNVILKVIIYYTYYPNQEDSKKIAPFLHAAIDNEMMKMLIKEYPKEFKKKPNSIASVDKKTYLTIKNVVKKFIADKHRHPNQITPVQFDDIYWLQLNRKKWHKQ